MPLPTSDGTQTVSNSPAPAATPVAQSTSAPGAPNSQQPAATQQPQSDQQPHPLSSYTHVSSDFKYGFDGAQWQPLSQVSNDPATPPPPPIVQHASVIRQVAQTLAGGPKWTTTIDPQTGQTTRTQVPMSKTDVGLAIALTALSGGLAGLAATGPGALGKAAGLGLQRGEAIQQQRAQAQQRQDQQAQQDADNSWQTTARKAQLMELNLRGVASAQQAERQSLDTMKDQVGLNADLLSQIQDSGAVSEQHVAQDAITAGIQSGKYKATDMTAIPDGVISTVDGRPELTFSIVPNTGMKSDLTQDAYDKYAAARVPGFHSGTRIPANGFPVSIFQLARANQQLGAIQMTGADLGDIKDVLSKSGDKTSQALGQSVPDIKSLLSDGANGAVFASDLLKLQKYVSHSNIHGASLAESLAQMSAGTKADPQNPKQTIANPDSAAGIRIIAAIGGGSVEQGNAILSAYHDAVTPEPIKNVTDAESTLSDPASTVRQKARASAFLAADRQQKAQTAEAETRARDAAKPVGTGSGTLNASALTPNEYRSIIDGIGTNTLDASQLLRYGKADQLKILADVKSKYPGFDATQYQANLGLAKWATSGKGGDIIQGLNTLHAHAQDFSENVNALGNTDSSLLNTPVNALRRSTGNPAVVATLGRLLAVRTEYLNVLNNNHALSVEDKANAERLLNENQSPSQWLAAINQVTHTADLRGAETNARYRATFGRDMPNYRAPQSAQGAANVVPPGATPGRDSSGRVIGYRTADGKVVRF